MGITYANVSISDLTGTGQEYSDKFLVDTGAYECLAPADKLRQIGVQPSGKDIYQLADGSDVELEHGYVLLRVQGQETPTRILFGQDDSEPLLGAIAMESLGFIVDPRSGTLKRFRSKPMK